MAAARRAPTPWPVSTPWIAPASWPAPAAWPPSTSEVHARVAQTRRVPVELGEQVLPRPRASSPASLSQSSRVRGGHGWRGLMFHRVTASPLELGRSVPHSWWVTRKCSESIMCRRRLSWVRSCGHGQPRSQPQASSSLIARQMRWPSMASQSQPSSLQLFAILQAMSLSAMGSSIGGSECVAAFGVQ